MPLENTSAERIAAIHAAQRDYFRSGATLPADFRRIMLRRMEQALRQWERRLCDESGAWRISLDSKDPAPTKFSDGSCVSPNIFLLREVLGIRIAEAGHTVIYFNPALNLVDWAEGTLTMARGRLKVKWEKLDDGSLDVTLDSNVPVKILPEMSHRLISNTTFRLGEQVTLLNPPAELVEDDEVEAEE